MGEEEIVDQSMTNEGEEAVEVDSELSELDTEKIKMLPGASSDGTAASFQIVDEDHTLGNALRYMIMKNPGVEFCGYSIPHPSESKLNIRIQTYGDTTAVQALHKGLDDLVDLCTHVEDKFSEKISEGNFATEEP
ncbi:hypothetical protein PACTADRAFT_49433 [Pachysolen tannophilus NRRL Y-2460]|uniref:DNA-directed RNA polymerase RBP11-like dimerisation domain-containing protein n=1 Tax=Pachysolen tannophilus NRRL Y-2460 TaxID=669874 RepID=A0A1E4TW95_PACTA|nr:hypothetical protein PACTADRAFT_49433 [Pachysolen tannophilus NRRL Y-2460]